ncbi:hypothetical protein BUALT_Bualt07G0138000 [Buddleja alternifolia]|uniref:Uncharacterized protein n=1 Tax=Buddleja alternifolia TaxID=168488 RepID=A0AAV6XIQ7_9LAMI|nr:hypothetical protein BUALT_Bualt07G0138000 [Buddleja alternifolia]
MNQGKTIRMIATITTLMLLFTTQASASFRKCYAKCLRACFRAGVLPPLCAPTCLPKCIKAEVPNNKCILDCAVPQCAQFKNDVDKVDGCVAKCETGKCKLLSEAVAYAPVSPTSGAPSS